MACPIAEERARYVLGAERLPKERAPLSYAHYRSLHSLLNRVEVRLWLGQDGQGRSISFR